MQRLHIDGRRGRRHAPRSENSGSSPLQLRLPCRNLIGVDVEMLRQLSYRPVALDGGKRPLRLEGRCVVPARSSVHGLSCSRRLSPLSGRNSTYRPVQICESGSDLAAGNMRLTDLTPPEWRANTSRPLEGIDTTGAVQPYEKEY